MTVNRFSRPLVALTAILIITGATSRCSGSGSPSNPSTGGPAIGSVAVGVTSVAAGVSWQGTVSITAPAPAGGATVSLSSSNPAVATVQSSVIVPAGASSVPMTVAAVATGTATIRATLNGSTGQSPIFTVTPRSGVVLTSISLSTASVVGGNSVTGTVGLSIAAPPGGAMVSLSASDPVTVPPSVTVPAGSASATFTVSTRAVGGSVSSTITGAYGGASVAVTFSVTPPTVATAHFGVTGPSETETCTLTNSGNTLNCTFNGSTSTAPGTITAWDWSYGVAKTFGQTTTGPVLTMPAVDCSLVPPPPMPAGRSWFTMVVKLKIHDNLGNVSAEAVNNDVRLIPVGVCGF
jgi:hypothetical protein